MRLGLSPGFKVKLNGVAKVFLGGSEGSALGRHRHVQAPRDKPFTIVLKHRMDHLHTVT
jgi:hypothetical protein